MYSLVIYDTKFGNTERVAEAVGRGVATLGSVRVMAIAADAGPDPERPDLLLLGGPTQRRGPSPALRAFLDSLPATLRGVPAAVFDTRYRGSTLLMGSAARTAAQSLQRSGTSMVAAPESFFITRGGPPDRQGLEAGEVDRAERWGAGVADAVRNLGLVTAP